MGNGQRLCADKEEAEAHKLKLFKLNSHTQEETLKYLETIKDELERFIYSDPSLTKTQWFRVEHCLKIVNELI